MQQILCLLFDNGDRNSFKSLLLDLLFLMVLKVTVQNIFIFLFQQRMAVYFGI